MFHRYVDHNGQKIDYDRAAWLMDKSVFDDAVAALPAALGQTDFDRAVAERNSFRIPEVTPERELQTLWDLYCALHERTHGKPFNPDVM